MWGFPGFKVLVVPSVLLSISIVQARPRDVGAGAPSSQALRLVEQGRCKQALSLLKKISAPAADKDLRYRLGMAKARCAMSVNQTQTVVESLLALRREFPQDPEVLYITTHYYSELANRASQELAAIAPSSYQAHQLEAEAFESQGKWDEAAGEYRAILAQNPQLPNIHYRLGQVYLSKQGASGAEDAKKEFFDELKVNPANAAAEFVLGELARQAGQWDEAITRFSKATKLDEGFLEAYLALGMSLNSAGKYSDAIAPLESYVRMEPSDPAGHYQLSTAYARVGRKEDAARELERQHESAAKMPTNSAKPGTAAPK